MGLENIKRWETVPSIEFAKFKRHKERQFSVFENEQRDQNSNMWTINENIDVCKTLMPPFPNI